MTNTTGNTITVACKIPNGIILRLGHKIERTEPVVMTGGVRVVTEWQPTGRTIELKGPRRFPGQTREQETAPFLNHGVAADAWENWLSDNRESPMFLNKQIFAHAKADHVDGMAADFKDIRSGLEALDPQRDPRTPRNVEVAERAA
jgi:hypothetical protein